jgi:hypothetical protein
VDDLEKLLEGLAGGWREKVPPQFYRTFEGQSFGTCDYCHQPLIVPGAGYMIHKFYAQGELQRETAMCRDCRNRLQEQYSPESRQHIQRMFSFTPDDRRLEIAAQAGVDRASQMTSHCLLCGTPKSALAAYFEYAYCQADEIVYFNHPMMICDQCTLRVYVGLSEATKEVRRRFYTEHYGLPPSGHFSEREDALVRGLA